MEANTTQMIVGTKYMCQRDNRTTMKYRIFAFIVLFLFIYNTDVFSQVSRYSQPFDISPPSSNIDLNQLDQTLSTLQDLYDQNYLIIQEKVNNCHNMIQLVKNYDNQSASVYQKKFNSIIDILNGERKIKYSDGSIVENNITDKTFFNYVTKQLDFLQNKMSRR
ncbi:hypothetical protein SAMN05660293_04716 [Dyadobacter psychrophilus]|uniref:Uncharacterized protein n=2 Tax=Dyadobacter psychrophilus TaxID=651661 RepID=A0A1T5H050_9BACT|nr:hypothetical protein SAMN05660293_04716 [Dyadobacter psychrophilus]